MTVRHCHADWQGPCLAVDCPIAGQPAPRFCLGAEGPQHAAETRPSPEEELRAMGVSASVSAAYDLLTDDGVPPEQAATMAVGAERSGRDAETFARHYLKLRKAARP